MAHILVQRAMQAASTEFMWPTAWAWIRHPRVALDVAFQPVQPSSGRWLRWLCPGHPPGRMMAVIQPSQPFGDRDATFGIFLDFMSLMQKDERGERTVEDRVHPSPPERCPQGSGAVLLKIEQSQLRLCALHS